MTKFTDRFIEVITVIYNPEEASLMGKRDADCEHILVTRKLNDASIESYNETIPANDFRDDNKIWTSVNMKSGDSFIVKMTLEEFEVLLNEQK